MAADVGPVPTDGEVTSRCLPWALNYLAFSHFTHWPEDSGTLTDAQKKDIKTKARRLRRHVGGQGRMSEFWQAHLWHWLERMAHNMVEANTASFY